MSDRELQAEIAGLLETVRPELTPELEVRAVAAVAAARARPARPRRRMIAVAVGAAVALVGLGFVPIPMGSAKGALDRAIANAGNARTVHVVYRELRHGFASEEWLSEDGFWRREYRPKGEPTQVILEADGWDASYTVDADGRTSDGEAFYDPCSLQPVPMPDRVGFFKRRHHLSLMGDQRRSSTHPAPQTREFREARLWSGEVDVFEERAVLEDRVMDGNPGHVGEVLYAKGDAMLTRAEFDARTGALLSQREYWLHDGGSELVSEETYEWNVEIPEELKQISLSSGRKLTRTGPWRSRAEQVIARGSTKDWVFTVHGIDVDHRGEILLWVSRAPTPDQNPDIYNSGPPMKVEAVGSAGERYTQDNGFSCMNSRYVGYWTTTLKPEWAGNQPARITLTIWPYASEPCEEQSLVFRDIPLPPRGNFDSFDELRAQEQDVVQY